MPYDISNQDIKRIADLARLGLTADEIARATKDLQDILNHFSAIQNINTTDTPVTDNITGLHNITRADKVEAECLCTADELLQRAPATHNRQVKVKAVFD